MKKCSEQDRQSHLRNLCLTDLYFLIRYGFKRKDLEREWLFQRCREVQANPNGYLDLWARDHYKSTIITFGQTIREILNDPEITISFFSHTRPIAKGFLKQVMRELSTNEMLKLLFPDVLWADPEKEAPKWSEDDGIIVKRKTNPKEATLEAWGLVEGQPTSKHFKLRVYDDVVTRENVTTPEQIKKTTEAWELSNNLGMDGGWERYIGTRYSLHDTYSEMIKRSAVKPRIHPATHNGKMDGKPVFFSNETWEDKKKKQSRKTIAAQLLQNPLADEDATFQPLWLRSWEIRPRTINVYILGDPNRKIGSTNDNCSFSVIAIGSTGVKYLVDGYCHQMTQSQRWTALRDLYAFWGKMPGVMSVYVGYEKYGAEQDLDYFEERQKEERIPFPIEELSWTRERAVGEQSKRMRIERLEPDFRNGRFLLPLAVLHNSKPCTWYVDRDPESKTYQNVIYREVEGLTKLQKHVIEAGSPELICKAIKRVDENGRTYDVTQKFIEEYLYFPFGEYKDSLDAASRVYDMQPDKAMLIDPKDGEPPQFEDS